MSKKKFPTYHIRADVNKGSINSKKRTVDVIFGTDAVLKRRTYRGEVYEEQLSFEPSHIKMDFLQSGRAPVLDNHNSWEGTRAVIGVIENARIENGRGFATLRFSKKPKADEIFKDIVDGIVNNVSVGYRVDTFEVTEKAEGPNKYRAIDWTPKEISTVPIPADTGAFVRNEDGSALEFEANIINFKNRTDMATKPIDKKNPPVAEASGGKVVTPNSENNRSDDQGNEPTPEPPAKPVDEGVRTETHLQNVNEAVQSALGAERKRASDIKLAVRAAMLDDSVAIDMVERGISIDAARAEILDKWAKDGPQIRSANASLTGPDIRDKKRAHIETALLHRTDQLKDENGKPVNEIPAEAREYRSMDLLEMARECLNDIGVNTRGIGKNEIAKMALIPDALRQRGAMSTSDFPLILGNTVNRVLRSSYQMAERTFLPFVRKTTTQDFKEKTVVQLSGLVDGFEKVLEGGEYKRSKMGEGGEKYKVEKFGRIIPFTWEMLINDDLGAFSRVPTAMAYQAAQKQSEIVYGILTGNPAMSDGTVLFHANHGNLGSAAALSEDSLSKARAMLRKQKALNKKDFINVTAKYLIVGPDLETTAQKLLTGITANTTGDVNIFAGSYTIIVDPRITGNQWYMSASPNMIDTIEIGFLDGQELFTEQRQGFDIDGMEIKARMVFGAKAIDHRGLFKNAGA